VDIVIGRIGADADGADHLAVDDDRHRVIEAR
jgi:hypothetical protein